MPRGQDRQGVSDGPRTPRCCAGGSPEGSFGGSPPRSTSNWVGLESCSQERAEAAVGGRGWPWPVHLREDGELGLRADLWVQGCERGRAQVAPGAADTPLAASRALSQAHPSLVSPGVQGRAGGSQPSCRIRAVSPAGRSHFPWEPVLGRQGEPGPSPPRVPSHRWLISLRRRSVPGFCLLALHSPRPQSPAQAGVLADLGSDRRSAYGASTGTCPREGPRVLEPKS